MPDALVPPSPIKFRWFFGVAGVFLIFIVIAAYSSRMAQDTDDYDHGRAAGRYATLAKLRAEDEKTLATADWVDQAKGVVRIPIDEAIPETLTALKAKPVGMGASIPGAVLAAGSPQAAPATNVAPANPSAPKPGTPNK